MRKPNCNRTNVIRSLREIQQMHKKVKCEPSNTLFFAPSAIALTSIESNNNAACAVRRKSIPRNIPENENEMDDVEIIQYIDNMEWIPQYTFQSMTRVGVNGRCHPVYHSISNANSRSGSTYFQSGYEFSPILEDSNCTIVI